MQSFTIINMTNFFNRELFMYSLGDIKFKKPVSLKKVAYTTLFLIIWTLPLFLIFGIKFNLLYVSVLLLPPILLGNFASKPVFGGKTLMDFIKTGFKFLQEPRGWTDLSNSKSLDKETYFVENEIWIGRRRELYKLAEMDEEND